MHDSWLTRFRRSLLLVADYRSTSDCTEMSEHVFQALIEGRLSEVEHELDNMEEDFDHYSVSSITLSEAPIRVIALAALCKALPPDEEFATMARPGSITLITCRPHGIANEVAWALRRLLSNAAPGSKFDVTVTCASEGPRNAGQNKVESAIDAALGGIDARILIVNGPEAVPPRFAALLPESLVVGPPDREMIAVAVTVAAGSGTPCGADELPSDAALRRIGIDGLRMALRLRGLPEIVGELHRLADRVAAHAGQVTLDDISGYGEAEEVGRQLVSDLRAWSQGEIGWTDMTRSVLLHGEPGTGKTFLARAIAASAEVPLITGSFAAWQAAGHLGDMLREMRRTFSEARDLAPSVLFIDEVDAAGDRGAKDRHAENYRRQVINGFLELMDGVAARDGVAVIAACNDLDALDPAIRRPGRIDRIVRVPRPGRAAVEKILTYHAGDVLRPEEIRSLARLATGRTAAELDGAVREAKGLARALRRPLSARDVAAALGLEDEDPNLLWRVAVHEAGHAIVAARLRRGVIGAIRVGTDGGHVHLDPPAPNLTAGDIADHIAFLLAGRAAEEMIFAEASIGAGGRPDSDLAMATDLSLRLELAYGLTEHGLLYHPDPARAGLGDPATRQRADQRLNAGRSLATAILRKEEQRLRKLAQFLCQERVLEATPAERDLSGRLMRLCDQDGQEQREGLA